MVASYTVLQSIQIESYIRVKKPINLQKRPIDLQKRLNDLQKIHTDLQKRLFNPRKRPIYLRKNCVHSPLYLIVAYSLMMCVVGRHGSAPHCAQVFPDRVCHAHTCQKKLVFSTTCQTKLAYVENDLSKRSARTTLARIQYVEGLVYVETDIPVLYR